jgi:hypothetical protein
MSDREHNYFGLRADENRKVLIFTELKAEGVEHQSWGSKPTQDLLRIQPENDADSAHLDWLIEQSNEAKQKGFFSKAAELMHQAYHFSQALNDLDDTIYYYGLAGHFHQVALLLKIWDEVSFDKAHRFSRLAGEAVKFMDEQNVNDADLEGLINIAMSILRQNHFSITPKQIEIDFLADESSRWFHYGIPLHESVIVAKLVEMDFELAERSVDECPLQIIRGGFVPMFEVVGEE